MASTMMRSHRHEARVRPGPLGPHGLKGWRGVLWLRSAGRVLRRTGGSRIAAVLGEGGRSKAGRAAGGVRAISELSYVRVPTGRTGPCRGPRLVRGARRRACSLPITIAGCHRSRSRCVCPGFDAPTYPARAPNLCRGAMVGGDGARKRGEPLFAVALAMAE